jgi:hypothetical protein
LTFPLNQLSENLQTSFHELISESLSQLHEFEAIQNNLDEGIIIFFKVKKKEILDKFLIPFPDMITNKK